MQYKEEFFIQRKREVDKLLHLLNECKYSGSWDTKVDFNLVIKTISQDDFIITKLIEEIKKLEAKVKDMEIKEVKRNKEKNIIIGNEKVESILT